MPIDRTTLEAYINDAADHFKDPKEVLDHPELNKEEKRKILESWKVDEQELATATEENMGKDNSNMLSRVVSALQALDE